jgi:hypothetical protein
MTPRGNARNSRSKSADQESSSLVGDLLRRVKSPEVLAGVAGAAAAAHFTRHAVEHSEDDAPQDRADVEDEAVDEDEPQDEAAVETDDEADVEDEDENENENENENEAEPDDETEDEEEEESGAEDEASAEDEAGAETEDEAGDDQGEPDDEPHADRARTNNGPLGSDDDRMELLGRAREYAEQLTGHSVESFSGLSQEQEGWRVGVEVVEVSRVPSTTDVLASYELVVTAEGELVDFRRAGRYYRNATEGAPS